MKRSKRFAFVENAHFLFTQWICYSLVFLLGYVDLLLLDVLNGAQWAKTWLLRLNPDKCEGIVSSV